MLPLTATTPPERKKERKKNIVFSRKVRKRERNGEKKIV